MILVLGDTHGDMGVFKRAVNAAVESGAVALIHVGDFGFNHTLAQKLMGARWPLPIFVIDGNHEEFECLGDMTESIEFGENFFYMPRGSVATIDGLRIGFVGGASSPDKRERQKLRWYWSEKEVVTRGQVESLRGEKVDVLVTHCPPQSIIQKHFDPRNLEYMFDLPRTWRDPSADVIEELWVDLGRPPLYCGHMHRRVADGRVRLLDVNELCVMLESVPEATIQAAMAEANLSPDDSPEVAREDG